MLPRQAALSRVAGSSRSAFRAPLARPLPFAHSSALTANTRTYASAPEGASGAPSLFRRSRLLRWTVWGCGSMVFGVAALTSVILIHDAFTYREYHVGKVPTNPLALHPEPGGPKNLPIVQSFVDDEEAEDRKELAKKERLVIVGGGWGAVSILQHLDPNKYNVTLVSPSNFYLFTPLLPSATVGTVEPRSLVESLRKIISRVHGHYVQGRAVDLVMGSDLPPSQGGAERLLEVEVISGDEWGDGVSRGGRPETEGKKVYIPYDRLIVAVGSVTNTHGVPGLENCFHLKTIQDSTAIRKHIMDNLEIAALPTTTPEERDRLLSFVICGGGPTGVETASEIYDMVNEDVLEYFPKVLRASARVHLIQSREHILNTYSEHISKYAEQKFARDEVDIIVNARVKRVEPDAVIYTIKDKATGDVKEFRMPSGFTLWSTGIAMNPFTRRVAQILPNQSHLKALQIDSHLRVKGAPLGSVYALGDASTIDTRLIDYLYDFIDKCDQDKDGQLTYDEFTALAGEVGRKFPLASKHFAKLRDVFEKYDFDKSGTLSINEVATMFEETSKKMTALPATAQVASQQGTYLARKLNKLAKHRDRDENIVPHTAEDLLDIDDLVYKPFTYHNLGSLAYIGNAAAFDLDGGWSFAGGLVAMYMWRSVYLSEQVSLRTRLLLLSDYVKRGLFGRDLSRF